jgi:hypothetical protein
LPYAIVPERDRVIDPDSVGIVIKAADPGFIEPVLFCGGWADLNWIDAGEIPVIRVGRRIRIQKEAFDAFTGRVNYDITSLNAVIEQNRASVADALDQIADGIRKLSSVLRDDEQSTSGHLPPQ